MEYPAFDLSSDPQKLTTEFSLQAGQRIIGVYGYFDSKSVEGFDAVHFLAGLSFIVWDPEAADLMSVSAV